MSGKISYKCCNYPTCLFWQDKGPKEECEWCARNPNKEERKDICAECNRRKVTKDGLCFVCIDEIKYGDERYEEKDKEREEE